MRQVLMVLVVLVYVVAVPVEVAWFGWSFKTMQAIAPWWVTVVVLLCHGLCFVGIATLFDKRHPRVLP